MNLNIPISEEELRALLGQNDEGAVLRADVALPKQHEDGARLPLHASGTQDGELLQALKEVVKTLTVRVASLEGEVGRLRAELAAARGQQSSAEPRIVVEGITLSALPAEKEAAAAAQAVPQRAGMNSAAASEAGDRHEALRTKAAPFRDSFSAAWPALPNEPGSQEASIESAALPDSADSDPWLTPRAARHRKPKKKGFFARLFD